MSKTINTVQHNQSQHHVNGMIGACLDWELTEHGKEYIEDIDNTKLIVYMPI